MAPMTQKEIGGIFNTGNGSNGLPTKNADPISRQHRKISEVFNERTLFIRKRVVLEDAHYERAFRRLFKVIKNPDALLDMKNSAGFEKYHLEIDERINALGEIRKTFWEMMNGIHLLKNAERTKKLPQLRAFLLENKYQFLKDIAHEFSVAGLHSSDFILLYKDERSIESIAIALMKGGYSEDEIISGFSKAGFGAEVGVKAAEIINPQFEEIPSLTELTKRIHFIREAIERLLDSGEELRTVLIAVIKTEREKVKNSATDAEIACALAIQDARFKISAQDVARALKSAGIRLDEGFTAQIGGLRDTINRNEIKLLYAELMKNGK